MVLPVKPWIKLPDMFQLANASMTMIEEEPIPTLNKVPSDNSLSWVHDAHKLWHVSAGY